MDSETTPEAIIIAVVIIIMMIVLYGMGALGEFKKGYHQGYADCKAGYEHTYKHNKEAENE